MQLALLAWLVGVCLWDWISRRVPNAWLLAGACLILLMWAQGHRPFDRSGATAAAALGVVFVFVVPYALGLMGAADVKFAAALLLWLGPIGLLAVWIGASLLGAVHALVLLIWRRRAGTRRTHKREIPYAAHMATCTLAGIAWHSF